MFFFKIDDTPIVYTPLALRDLSCMEGAGLPEIGPSASSYAFVLAFSLTCPPASSTENSTSWQPYCLRISSVFFCTKVEKESRLPETFSPAFFLAATSVLNKRSTCSRSGLSTVLCKVTGCEVAGASAVAAAAAAAVWLKPYTGLGG